MKKKFSVILALLLLLVMIFPVTSALAASSVHINVKHVNMDDATDVLANLNYWVAPGEYGPYDRLTDEQMARLNGEYFYAGTATNSAAVSGNAEAGDEVEIVHIYRKQRKRDIRVQYKWEDQHPDSTRFRPGQATVILMGDGQEVARKTYNPRENLNMVAVYDIVFENMDVYADAYTEIKYAADDPQNYVGYTDNMGSGLYITRYIKSCLITVYYIDISTGECMEGTEPYKISVAFGRNYPIYPDGFEYLGYEMISPAPENCAPYIVSVTGDKDVYFYFSPW